MHDEREVSGMEKLEKRRQKRKRNQIKRQEYNLLGIEYIYKMLKYVFFAMMTSAQSATHTVIVVFYALLCIYYSFCFTLR